MKAKQWYSILVMGLVILISVILFNHYYQTYVKPESYTIGKYSTVEPYTELDIYQEYFTDDDVIVSLNVRNKSFAVKDGIATYECVFEPFTFNADKNDYAIFVNDIMLLDSNAYAGTIYGTHNLKYLDTERNTLCLSNISINFSFASALTTMRMSLSQSELPFLMNYFETDNYIITVTESPFVNKMAEDSLSIYDITYVVDNEIVEAIPLYEGEQYKVADIPEGYDYWEVVDNGNVVRITENGTYRITNSSLTFVAIKSEPVSIYTVTYMNGDQVYHTESYSEGETFRLIDLPSLKTKWKYTLNGEDMFANANQEFTATSDFVFTAV